MHYQPVIDTTTGQRRRRSRRSPAGSTRADGFIRPDTFIPLAEDSGLIIDLGHAVLLEACQQARRWHDAVPAPAAPDLGERVAAPTRAPQLHRARRRRARPRRPRPVGAHARSHRVGPGRRVGPDHRHARRAAPHRASASRSTTSAPATRRSPRSPSSRSTSSRSTSGSSTTSSAPTKATASSRRSCNSPQTLHLETIAEGVEQPEQQDALTALGCTHIQGYLYSRPMPGDQTDAFIRHVDATARPAPARLRVTAG